MKSVLKANGSLTKCSLVGENVHNSRKFLKWEQILVTRENYHNGKKFSEQDKIVSVEEIYKICDTNSLPLFSQTNLIFLKLFFK